MRSVLRLLFIFSFGVSSWGQPRPGSGGPEAGELVPLSAAEVARVRELVAMLGDDRWNVRVRATRDLVSIGVRATPALLAAWKETKSAEVRWRIDKVLDKTGGYVYSPRLMAVRIGSLFDDLKKQQIFYWYWRGDPYPRDQVMARRLVGLGKAVVPVAAARLATATEENLKANLVFWLARLADRRAVPALVKSLGDASPMVSGLAAYGLGRIGEPGSIPALVELAQRARDKKVGTVAIESLAGFRSKEVVDALIGLLASSQVDVRFAASYYLGRITGVFHGFNAYRSPEERRAAAGRWKGWWMSVRESFRFAADEGGDVRRGAGRIAPPAARVKVKIKRIKK